MQRDAVTPHQVAALFIEISKHYADSGIVAALPGTQAEMPQSNKSWT
jgi:hypothetical protein